MYGSAVLYRQSNGLHFAVQPDSITMALSNKRPFVITCHMQFFFVARRLSDFVQSSFSRHLHITAMNQASEHQDVHLSFAQEYNDPLHQEALTSGIKEVSRIPGEDPCKNKVTRQSSRTR